jgi:hypothetical protein
LKAAVEGEPEPQGVDIEAQAPIQIPDEDPDRLHSEMGVSRWGLDLAGHGAASRPGGGESLDQDRIFSPRTP